MNTIFSKVKQYDKELENRGFHKGSGGLIYSIQKAIICFDLGDDWQIKFNKEIIDKIFEKQKFENEPYDVYGGTAGTLWGLLLMKKMLGSKFAYEAEVNQLKNIFLNYQGLWKTDKYFNNSIGKSHPYLVGLPHGVTGIAYVLGLYQQIYKNSEFTNIINDAIEYEQNHRRFEDVWISASVDEGKYSTPAAAWEKALGGVGFSQLALHKLDLNKYYHKNIDAILKRLLPQSMDLFIKYVSSGVLDFYIEYNSNSVIPLNILDSLEPIIDEFNKENLVLIGVKNNQGEPFIHPSLIGFAGLGMSILRLYDSKAVDSYILPS